MKKAIGLLAVALLVAMTGAAWAQVATVQCVGTESGGLGGTCGLPYVYVVTPGLSSVTDVWIGTGDPAIVNYRQLCLPAGWTLTIEAAPPNYLDDPKTPHNNLTGSSGACPYRMHWSGPAMAVPFELGFYHPFPSHDVSWDVSDGATVNWGALVGMGMGPVHGPPEEDHQVPTLSQWGMMAVVLLLLALGTLFIVRRKRSLA